VFRTYILERSLEDFSVCAYNQSCAVRALELMGFPTISEDMDEEVYSLLNARGENLLFLETREAFLQASERLGELESKILRQIVTPQEKEEYLLLFKDWIEKILLAPFHKLFRIFEGG